DKKEEGSKAPHRPSPPSYPKKRFPARHPTTSPRSNLPNILLGGDESRGAPAVGQEEPRGQNQRRRRCVCKSVRAVTIIVTPVRARKKLRALCSRAKPITQGRSGSANPRATSVAPWTLSGTARLRAGG